MNHKLKLHLLTNSSPTPQNPSQLSAEQTLTRFVKISNERKMALPTQMVLVCSGVILKIQTKANLISKNIHKVSRTIWRYEESELRNYKLVKNFKLFAKFKKSLPQLSMCSWTRTHWHLHCVGRRLPQLQKHKAQRLRLNPLLATILIKLSDFALREAEL